MPFLHTLLELIPSAQAAKEALRARTPGQSGETPDLRLTSEFYEQFMQDLFHLYALRYPIFLTVAGLQSYTMPTTEKKRNILVVDDEPQITRVLTTTLTSHGYEIRTASDGDEALQVMKEWPPDLLITDLCMPNMDGLQLCRSVRTRSTIPIIVLSVRGEDQAKVEALDAGADDYVTKPFGIHELMARVRAALRRAWTVESPQASAITIGDFHIDMQRRTVQVKSHEVHLTPKEFDLLVFLAQRAGKVITHRALLFGLWGESDMEQIDTLRVFVGHLRKKLETEGPARYIRTEHWIGYRFEPGD
jgi:two-component system, OmpR family, KDP operon response regulator KdpE